MTSKIYRNFCWAITWEITRRCNLRCSYCLGPKEDRGANMARALRQIINLKPKFILITGGEPLLVPGLKELIQKIKSQIDAYVVLNTNATFAQRTIDLVPYVDGFQISLDGLGEVNKLTKGISGDLIFDCLVELINETKRRGVKRLLNIVPAITRTNCSYLSSLVQRLNDLSPDIQVICQPMHPYDHPDSIASNPGDYQKFCAILQGLSRDGFKVRVSGPFSNQGLLKEARCYRQYFRGFVTVEGNLFTCKPHRYARYFLKELKKSISSKNIHRFISILSQAFNSLIIHRYDPLCFLPCGCEDFIDPILFPQLYPNLCRESYELLLRIPPSEVRGIHNFIKRNINPDFDIEVFNSERLRKIKSGLAALPVFANEVTASKS